MVIDHRRPQALPTLHGRALNNPPLYGERLRIWLDRPGITDGAHIRARVSPHVLNSKTERGDRRSQGAKYILHIDREQHTPGPCETIAATCTGEGSAEELTDCFIYRCSPSPYHAQQLQAVRPVSDPLPVTIRSRWNYTAPWSFFLIPRFGRPGDNPNREKCERGPPLYRRSGAGEARPANEGYF